MARPISLTAYLRPSYINGQWDMDVNLRIDGMDRRVSKVYPPDFFNAHFDLVWRDIGEMFKKEMSPSKPE